jgi:serpin B
MTMMMCSRLLALLLAGLASMASVGCDSESTTSQEITPSKSSLTRVTDPQVSEADQATLAADNAGFALDAYHKIAAEHANLVFSPASVSIALSMAYAGAAGTTASEMASALHFTLPAERLYPAFDSLDLNLASRGQDKKSIDGGPMQVKIVNAAWAERTYQFRSEYLDILAANFGAGLNLVDFVKNWESARITINDWVAGQTNDRIQDLLPEGSLDTLTRLVLTNAVYLNAAWKEPFDPDHTSDSTFTLLNGNAIKTKFMGTHLGAARAIEGDGFRAVALPYDDERLSMLLLVPDSGTFETFETSLNASKLNSIVAGLVAQPVNLGMPRFRTETAQDFAPILGSLGMHAAFQPGVADFSGMDGTQYLYISMVLHKAFIDVGEKGTEAAAATAVVASGGAAPPTGINIYADHPFIYILRDEPTGAILFMGRVLDPSKS